MGSGRDPISDGVRRKAGQPNRPQGVIFQQEAPNITVWVRTWSQILTDAKARLDIFQKKLNYQANSESGLAHLKAAYEKYLPHAVQVLERKVEAVLVQRPR
jgi:hypothetical protein